MDPDQADTTVRSRKRYQESALPDIEERPDRRCTCFLAPARETDSPATGAAQPSEVLRDL